MPPCARYNEYGVMSKLLPTANPAWGFCGTNDRNGNDKELNWEVAYDAISIAFDLTMQEVSDLLDSNFGRHLVDDLRFITIGPKGAEAIELQLIAHYESACCRGGPRLFKRSRCLPEILCSYDILETDPL